MVTNFKAKEREMKEKQFLRSSSFGYGFHQFTVDLSHSTSQEYIRAATNGYFHHRLLFFQLYLN